MTKPIPPTILKRAQALIKDGWTQGTFYNGSGSYCALGAVYAVTSKRENQDSAASIGTPYGQSIVDNYLKRSLPEGFYSVAAFNDNLKTAHDDVLALYDRAIALAEQDR